MLKLNIKSKKYFFLLSFRSIFLNFNYLIFFKFEKFNFNLVINRLQNYFYTFKIGFKKIMAKNLVSLFNNNYFKFLKNNHFLIYFNEYFYFNRIYEELLDFSLYALSFSGYLVNNNYLLNIDNYYIFYCNNYLYLINNYY